ELMQAVGVPWGASPRHTEELAMTSAPILAVDLGKYKCVACAYGRAAAAAAFHTVTTSRAELARLIGRLRPAVVVIEACSLARWAPRPVRRAGRPLQGRQHGRRGVAVQARQAEDRPRRRPPAGPPGGPRPASRGGGPGQAGPGVAGVDRPPPGPGHPAGRRPE